MIGVLGCFAGMIVYCLLTQAWTLPLLSVAGIFALGGLVVFACYHWDALIKDRQLLADRETERAELARQLKAQMEQ